MAKFAVEIQCSVLEVNTGLIESAFMRTAIVVHVEAEHLHQAAERVGKLLEQGLQGPAPVSRAAEPKETSPPPRRSSWRIDFAFLGTILLFIVAALIRECRSWHE
jgi:hypothetical protein